MLLVGATLLVQSILRLERQTTGFREDHLLKAHIYLPPAHYPTSQAITRFCDRFAERIRALPGVGQATVTTIYPPFTRWTQMFTIEGHAASRLQDVPTTRFGVTDDHYLETLRIPLIEGRDFAASDTESREPVALINQEFVRRYFAHRDPVGVRIRLGPPANILPAVPADSAMASGYVTVVGVMGNARNNGLAFPPEPQLNALFRQLPIVNYGFKDVVIRTVSDPQAIASALRRQLHDLDPNLPLAEVQTMERHIADQTSDQRFVTLLLSLFAAAGLALAIIGIYGVVSYLVAQRSQELGVRLALGASPPHVLWLVLKQGLSMGAAGVALGLLGAWSGRQVVGRLLFGISAVDAVTFAGAAALLLAIAAIASAVPGTRAMRIDPASALRQE
jgi:predicted permease